MPQVLVRGLDADVVDRLKARARRNGRSLQAELKVILESAAGPDWTDFRRAADRIRKLLGGRTFSDSVEMLREDRQR